MKRSWYSSAISEFLNTADEQILAELVLGSTFSILEIQRNAWVKEISILRAALQNIDGWLSLEFDIPRMGRRIDAVIIINGIVIAIEFKIAADHYLLADIDQAYDYAIDLKYFHEASHNLTVIPLLVATNAPAKPLELQQHPRIPGLYRPILTNQTDLCIILHQIVQSFPAQQHNPKTWENSPYRPTPTIIEAARALYAGHSVEEISRNDAGAINLAQTSEELFRVINQARDRKEKAICFVTGVPGAGKTLVGLNIATRYSDKESELYSVFLSGNKPLVDILREALARDPSSEKSFNMKKNLRKGRLLHVSKHSFKMSITFEMIV